METEVNLTKRILKGGTVMLLFILLSSPMGYLLRILYSRSLNIESYGLFYSVLALFSLFATYNDLGFGYSVAYLVPKFIRKKNFAKAWLVYKYDQLIELVTSVIISVLLCITAKILAVHYFKNPDSELLVYVFSIYFIANSLVSALNKLFVGLQKEKYYSSMEFLRLLFTLTYSFLIFILNQASVISFAFCWAGTYVTLALIYNFLLRHNYRHLKGVLNYDKSLFNKMKNFAIPTLMTTSIFTLVGYTDTIFLTLFRGVKDVGIYNIVLPMVSISSIFLSPINMFLFPLISHLHGENEQKIKLLINKVLQIIPFISLYFALFIVMYPTILVQTLFGSKWMGMVETPIIVLSLCYIASSTSSFLNTFVAGIGKVKERFRYSIIIALLNIFLSLTMIYKFGVLGAVITSGVVNLFSVFIYGLILNKTIPFKYPLGVYFKLMMISIFIYTLSKAVPFTPKNLIQIIYSGLTYTTIMTIVGFYLNIFDINMIKSLLKKDV